MRGKYHMKKSSLIETLAVKEELTEKQAMAIVNLMFKGFANELRNNLHPIACGQSG